MTSEPPTRRYAAKLLFQFRVDLGPDSGRRRTCEERIINLDAATPRAGLDAAKQYGHDSEFEYVNSDGNPVFFEFVGVMGFVELMFPDSEEVWHDIYKRLEPMERRDHFVPADEVLLRGMD